MTKNSFFIFVMILVIGFAVWFTRFGKDIKKTQEIVLDQQEKTQKLIKRQTASVPESQAQKTSINNEPAKEKLREDLRVLSDQLLQENSKLESQRNHLERLKQERQPQIDINYGSRIRSAADEIANLTNSLQDYQWMEGELSQRANQAYQQQDLELKLSTEQMDQNIRTQEEQLKMTQNELEFWKLNNNYVNQKEDRVQYLENLFIEQTQQLNAMKVQRVELTARALQQSQNIESQARKIASEMNDGRADTQNAISDLRDEIQRLVYLQNQSRTSQMSILMQIQQSEKNIQGQQEAIHAIQDLIREKEQSLEKLR